jgi:hypothetical protein
MIFDLFPQRTGLSGTDLKSRKGLLLYINEPQKFQPPLLFSSGMEKRTSINLKLHSM